LGRSGSFGLGHLLEGARGMITYEDITALFIRSAEAVGLATHPEHWVNSQTGEREFAVTCHAGTCEEAENRSTVTASFTWGPLDTVLSQQGPLGICDFFHEPDEEPTCPHLHTDQVPP
jgi:hypothetical protein